MNDEGRKTDDPELKNFVKEYLEQPSESLKRARKITGELEAGFCYPEEVAMPYETALKEQRTAHLDELKAERERVVGLLGEMESRLEGEGYSIFTEKGVVSREVVLEKVAEIITEIKRWENEK